MRRPLVVGNWKMNTSLSDALVLTTAVKNAASDLEEAEIVLCPPFMWLVSMRELLEHASPNLKLGAQDMWFADKGAMTGEISALMLKDIAEYVILGHSERRIQFKENNDLVNDKLHAAVDNGLTPILCVNESKKMSDPKKSLGETITMLKESLEGISKEKVEQVVIAFEPIWAISTTKNSLGAATGEYSARAIFELRNVIAEKYDQETANSMRFLYGGSVDASNIKEFIYQPEIDGVLVGGASLKANEFIKICEKAAGREED